MYALTNHPANVLLSQCNSCLNHQMFSLPAGVEAKHDSAKLEATVCNCISVIII